MGIFQQALLLSYPIFQFDKIFLSHAVAIVIAKQDSGFEAKLAAAELDEMIELEVVHTCGCFNSSSSLLYNPFIFNIRLILSDFFWQCFILWIRFPVLAIPVHQTAILEAFVLFQPIYKSIFILVKAVFK